MVHKKLDEVMQTGSKQPLDQLDLDVTEDEEARELQFNGEDKEEEEKEDEKDSRKRLRLSKKSDEDGSEAKRRKIVSKTVAKIQEKVGENSVKPSQGVNTINYDVSFRNKTKTREEKKIEMIMKTFEAMEKKEARKRNDSDEKGKFEKKSEKFGESQEGGRSQGELSSSDQDRDSNHSQTETPLSVPDSSEDLEDIDSLLYDSD